MTKVEISVEQVAPRRLAAVRRRLRPEDIRREWGPALDLVWPFLRKQDGLWAGGHNVFLYWHPAPGEALIDADFGVEVARSFEPSGEVREVYTPAGEAAVAVHRGAYDRLGEAHSAVRSWAREQGRIFGVASWEIYGDPQPEPERTETIVVYLLG